MRSSQQFSQFRSIDNEDAVMIASLGFKKQLWALDKRLDVIWNLSKCRWEIWMFPGQENIKKKKWDEKASYVMTVTTKSGGYRELGADILLKLQQGDTRKYSLKQLIDYFDKLDDNLQRQKREKLFNRIHDMNVDWVNYATTYTVPVPKEYIFNSPKVIKVSNALGGCCG